MYLQDYNSRFFHELLLTPLSQSKLSSPVKQPVKNSAFDQLKPLSPRKLEKKAEESHTDVLTEASDSEGSVLSDGVTTGNESDHLTTV